MKKILDDNSEFIGDLFIDNGCGHIDVKHDVRMIVRDISNIVLKENATFVQKSRIPLNQYCCFLMSGRVVWTKAQCVWANATSKQPLER